MSFGDSESNNGDNPISLLVDSLTEHNITPIISAGNNGILGPRTIGTPGGSKKAITIGAINFDGEMYIKSSRGPTLDGRYKPDLVTPGINILGADLSNNSGTSASSKTRLPISLDAERTYHLVAVSFISRA